MGAGGLQTLARAGWPMAGKRVVVAGSGPLLFSVAAHLRQAGAKVVLVAEQTSWIGLLRFGLTLPVLSPGKLVQAAVYQMRLLGIRYRPGCWPVSAHGKAQVEGVTLSTGARTWTVPCDVLACGFNLVPNLELPRLLGCSIVHDKVSVDLWQQTSVANVYCAGEPTGLGGVDRALIEGQIAGLAITGQQDRARRLFASRGRTWLFSHTLERGFALRDEVRHLASPGTIVCRCEDVTLRQLQAYDNWRAAKLHTRCGMGACQGRICGEAVRTLLGWQPQSVRSPVFPTRIVTLVGAGGEEVKDKKQELRTQNPEVRIRK
jgi:D-hydroxyproline dehydrogenase subunit alpha